MNVTLHTAHMLSYDQIISRYEFTKGIVLLYFSTFAEIMLDFIHSSNSPDKISKIIYSNLFNSHIFA